MKRSTPRRLWKYAAQCLGLRRYLESPGDGRPSPQIPARALLWALLIGRLLREHSYYGVEALVRSPARRALRVGRRFGKDALGYFTERLDPALTRAALVTAIGQAKRNQAFDSSRWIGLAVDGTTVGRRSPTSPTCSLCRPWTDKAKKVHCYLHHFAMVSVVGTGLSLPFDVEPYGKGDSEYSAAQRLLRRAGGNLGARFADYVVADGEFARSPFLHAAGDLGLPVILRLKANWPELSSAAQKRFAGQPPDLVFSHNGDRIEVWDADDLDPWETLRWQTVRVLRYHQHKPNGDVIQALWFTDFPQRLLGSRSFFHLAKSRWEIENQGFNDAKNRYGLEPICHHEPSSLLID